MKEREKETNIAKEEKLWKMLQTTFKTFQMILYLILPILKGLELKYNESRILLMLILTKISLMKTVKGVKEANKVKEAMMRIKTTWNWN